MPRFADVAVNVPLRAGDRVFTFSIPPALLSRIEPGVPVRVKFGPRSTSGYVVRLLEDRDAQALSSLEGRTVRPLSAVDERLPALPPDLLALAEWMSQFYVCTVGEAIGAMLPPLSGIPGPRRLPSSARRAGSDGAGRRRTDRSAPAVYTAGPAAADVRGGSDPSTGVAEEVVAALAAGRQVAVIGGGGRFTAYVAAVRQVLAAGSHVVLLVPEVAQAERLVPWLAARIETPVVMVHGGQSAAVRWATWKYLQAAGPLAVVGTRLASFAPVPRLGLVIVEHEEDTSYKEERMPRYLVRRVVTQRAGLTGAAVLWGAPAPSVDLMREVDDGRVTSIVVPASTPASVAIADVRSDAGPLGGLFGRRLYQALARTLPTAHAIVFVPRRGYADFLLCHECGNVPKCPRCDVAMTYHVPERTLRCHLCGREDPAPTVCPSCGGTNLRPHGIGTERVEAAARRLFKRTLILRLDSDAAPEESDQLQIWQQFGRRGGLLIGTQLLVKGVGQVASDVVGALGVDAALNLPDFTAAERTFQILTQLIDLARKEAVIQTFSPQHPVMVALRRRDPAVFYSHELSARRRFGYPPFTTLINLIVTGPQAEDVRDVAGALATGLESTAEVLGPSPAPVPKMRGRARWQVLIKDTPDAAARRILPQLLTSVAMPRTVKVVIDVDPVDLL